ncbi:hypothetical protein L1049_022152 [Liquidambar formosana]|uniref:Zinc finger PMZ-type domain-containing protein n=1 Tax=Liquidambar formosana TaxID=63359 RepID=A0AAP0WQN4_LIQFO
MCESFNGYILEARDKPIIKMLEMVRETLMMRMQEKKEFIKNYKGPICPNIQSKLEDLKVQSRKCLPTWCGQRIYEIKCFPDKYIVDSDARTCSCRKWDLIGIPSIHAISTIRRANEKPKDYVHLAYTVETYKRTYEHMIYPVSSEKFWAETDVLLCILPHKEGPLAKNKGQAVRGGKKRGGSAFDRSGKVQQESGSTGVGSTRSGNVQQASKSTCVGSNISGHMQHGSEITGVGSIGAGKVQQQCGSLGMGSVGANRVQVHPSQSSGVGSANADRVQQTNNDPATQTVSL